VKMVRAEESLGKKKDRGRRRARGQMRRSYPAPLFIPEGDRLWGAVKRLTSGAVARIGCHVEEEGGTAVRITVPLCARCQ
jgi:hypothetical protein